MSKDNILYILYILIYPIYIYLNLCILNILCEYVCIAFPLLRILPSHNYFFNDINPS